MNTQDYYSEPVDDFRNGYQYGRRYTREAGLFSCMLIRTYMHTYIHTYSIFMLITLCEKSVVILLCIVLVGLIAKHLATCQTKYR